MKSVAPPPELSRQVSANWGPTGTAWLAELPARIEAIALQLGLKGLMPDPGMSLHWIGHSHWQNQAVTLKLGVPDSEFEAGLRALTRMQSNPRMVRMLDGDPVAGWLLMERIEPGSSLSRKAMPEGSLDPAADLAALEIWLEQLSFMPANELDHQRFPDLARWCRDLRAPDLPPELSAAAAEAWAMYERLAPGEQDARLLHGDLHHDNLLWSESRGWVLIDPQGLIAGPEFELGAMLRNPYPHLNTSAELEPLLRARLERIAADPRFRFERVMDWAYVQAVLAACWSRHTPAEAALWLRVATALAHLAE